MPDPLVQGTATTTGEGAGTATGDGVVMGEGAALVELAVPLVEDALVEDALVEDAFELPEVELPEVELPEVELPLVGEGEVVSLLAVEVPLLVELSFLNACQSRKRTLSLWH